MVSSGAEGRAAFIPTSANFAWHNHAQTLLQVTLGSEGEGLEPELLHLGLWPTGPNPAAGHWDLQIQLQEVTPGVHMGPKRFNPFIPEQLKGQSSSACPHGTHLAVLLLRGTSMDPNQA